MTTPSEHGDWKIVHAISAERLAEARTLFEEYAAELSFDLGFQDFAVEVANLPGAYAPPRGALLLGQQASYWTGCVAMQPIDETVCEMKRLFVRSPYRACGWGYRLVQELLAVSRAAGYERMRLDTVPSMTKAIALYEALGFQTIAPYRFNPVPGATFMELRL